MRRGIFTLTLASMLFVASPASSATLTAASSKDGKVIVTLIGEIAEGDTDALKTIIQTANSAGHLVTIIRLDSPGGNIRVGVKLADMIRFGKIATSVVGTSTCASACFIAFAAGSVKYANYAASVGVHGASDESGQETVQSNAATVTVARIIKELGVPPSIIGKMVITPPDEMVWLTPDDLRSMGTTMTGQPAQVRELPSNSLSSQLRPPEKSATPNSTPPQSWEKILDRAIELSEQQNGGTPDISRLCQPEFKECINALAFKGKDGTDMIMKVTEDMNGKMLRRELCSFNSYGDIRTCVDWDKNESHRSMKNKNGDWYKVDD
jgi:hypothetical protein